MSFEHPRSRLLLAGVILAMTAAPLALAATEESEPIRLVVRAPKGCPDEAAFFEAIRRRTSRARLAEHDEAARTFRITIRPRAAGAGASGTSAEWTVVDADGKTSAPRTIRGSSCEDVATALELVTALAIDPDAQMDMAAGAVDAGPGDANDGATEALDATASAAGNAADAETAHVAQDASSGTTDDAGLITLAGSFELPSPPIVVAAGAGIAIVGSGNAPISVATLRFVDLRKPARAGSESVVAPSLRLDLSTFVAHSPSFDGADAHFAWYLASLDVCPIRVSFASAIAFTPCAIAEAGALHASSSGTVTFESDTVPWLAAGALARFELTLADPVFVELAGSVRVPIVRKEFIFDPDVLVYRVPLFLAGAGIDVGVLFR